jgi:predicted ester cyclase
MERFSKLCSTKQNKASVCRFIDEAYNKRNLTVGDELLAANLVLHVSDSDIKGIEGWKQYAGSFLAGFSDIVISVKDIIADGDKVVANWLCHGIHTGELQGIAPTGKQATWTGIAIYRFVDSKIEEVWVWNDIWGMMRQLGVIPLDEGNL